MSKSKKVYDKETEAIFQNLAKAIITARKTCQSKGYELRYFFSFFMFESDKSKTINPVKEWSHVLGERKTLIGVIQGLKDNIDMEPKEFIDQ